MGRAFCFVLAPLGVTCPGGAAPTLSPFGILIRAAEYSWRALMIFTAPPQFTGSRQPTAVRLNLRHIAKTPCYALD